MINLDAVDALNYVLLKNTLNTSVLSLLFVIVMSEERCLLDLKGNRMFLVDIYINII